MVDGAEVICIGDLMLELFVPNEQSPPVQRTYKVDHAAAAVGGAALNLCWYLDQLQRPSIMVAGFGAADRSRVEAALAKVHVDVASLVQLSGATDVLAVLPGKDLPAVYIRGQIPDRDLAALADRIHECSAVIFGGSRHEGFRRIVLEKIQRLRETKFVFSPSYSVYDFGRVELNAFMAASDITVVNEHEAKYLVELLTKTDKADLMRLPKHGGVVTLGPGGADLFFDGDFAHVVSVSGRGEDVIGAGEAFAAGFTHEYMKSRDWRQSGRVGCAVAAQVVCTEPKQVRARIDTTGLLSDLKRFS
jgi:sugar/nucleoside kinase (ribokinase family)